MALLKLVIAINIRFIDLFQSVMMKFSKESVNSIKEKIFYKSKNQSQGWCEYANMFGIAVKIKNSGTSEKGI